MSYPDQLLGDDAATEIVISLLLGAAKSREMFACAPAWAWVCRWWWGVVKGMFGDNSQQQRNELVSKAFGIKGAMRK